MALCVLTGDIVGSTRLTDAEHIRVMALLGTTHIELSNGRLSFLNQFRGDGWQMAFPQQTQALRDALYIRATLRADNVAFETRIAVAEGTENANFSDAKSPTFVASGRALDHMPSDILMTHANGGALQAATLLADHISRDWTQAQARAIRPFLLPHVRTTQKDVAETLGISRQAVGQALDAAGYGVLNLALAAIEEQVK